MPGLLVEFYLGAPDDRGRMLDAILAQDNEWLEYTHNFIQWLFPLTTASGANPTAPVLDAAQISEFRSNPQLRQRLRLSFERMLGFYGLAPTPHGIEKAPDWDQRKTLWFTHPSHNHLRITRILKCLNTLGLAQEAKMFFQALAALRETEQNCGIPDSAFAYWENAIKDWA